MFEKNQRVFDELKQYLIKRKKMIWKCQQKTLFICCVNVNALSKNWEKNKLYRRLNYMKMCCVSTSLKTYNINKFNSKKKNEINDIQLKRRNKYDNSRLIVYEWKFIKKEKSQLVNMILRWYNLLRTSNIDNTITLWINLFNELIEKILNKCNWNFIL